MALPVSILDALLEGGYFDQITRASDCVTAFTYADFSLSTQRVTSIVYTAASVPGKTATKTFSYTLTSGLYRLDSITRSIA